MTGLPRAGVVKRLRKAAANRARALPGAPFEDYAKSLGFGVIAAMDCPGKTASEALEQLADLVDCPECRMELVDTTDSAWGEVRAWECSNCGDVCEETMGSYGRCPNCGAVVRGWEQ